MSKHLFREPIIRKWPVKIWSRWWHVVLLMERKFSKLLSDVVCVLILHVLWYFNKKDEKKKIQTRVTLNNEAMKPCLNSLRPFGSTTGFPVCSRKILLSKLASDVIALILQTMFRFRNPIFPTVQLALPINPLSSYLPVWNNYVCEWCVVI